jgi:hypothetical protein
VETSAIKVLADGIGTTPNGGRVGLLVWGSEESITGLEVSACAFRCRNQYKSGKMLGESRRTLQLDCACRPLSLLAGSRILFWILFLGFWL